MDRSVSHPQPPSRYPTPSRVPAYTGGGGTEKLGKPYLFGRRKAALACNNHVVSPPADRKKRPTAHHPAEYTQGRQNNIWPYKRNKDKPPWMTGYSEVTQPSPSSSMTSSQARLVQGERHSPHQPLASHWSGGVRSNHRRKATRSSFPWLVHFFTCQ